MRTGTLAFIAGILVLSHLAQLPAVGWIPPFIVLIVTLPWLARWLRIVAWFCVGFVWAWLVGLYSLNPVGLAEIEGRDVVVEGRIVALPDKSWKSVRFEFQPDSLRLAEQELPVPGRLRLSWYRQPTDTTPLKSGDRWRFTVRLKAARGFQNPGGFDYEAWLFQHGIHATGYVRKHAATRLGGPDFSGLPGHVRQFLYDRLNEVIGSDPYAGIVIALGLGERSGITPEQWEVLRRTGTNHLVAISGLHVGLVAGLAFLMGRRGARLSASLVHFLPAPRFGALVAVLAALVYAALAGFAIPTQRALIMVTVVMAAVWRQQPVSLLDSLLLALLVVLVYDPFAVLAVGFWLSFGAVAVIAYAALGRLAPPRRGTRWLNIQLAVSVGLLPLLFGLFGRASLVSPLANVVAVPVVGFVLVPLVLIGLAVLPVAPDVAAGFFHLTLWIIQLGWQGLAWLAAGSLAQIEAPELSWPVLALGALAAGLLLAPRGVPGRWLGLVLLLPLLFTRVGRPIEGDFQFTLLDVGQGLASVVTTRRHALVYDTGARFSSRFDAGSAVVLPYLRSRGIKAIDKLVLSHADNDHAGGANEILRQIPVKQVLTSEQNSQLHFRQDRCQHGQSWTWDGVRFEMLFPEPGKSSSKRRNDHSCVLKVNGARHSVLLAGDIEAATEQRLVARYGDKLQASVLVVPHHGSKTSSTRAFVRAVQPALALFPVGYRNRYRFPAETVVSRYSGINARMYDTAQHGAIELYLPDAGDISVSLFRPASRRFWSRN